MEAVFLTIPFAHHRSRGDVREAPDTDAGGGGGHDWFERQMYGVTWVEICEFYELLGQAANSFTVHAMGPDLVTLRAGGLFGRASIREPGFVESTKGIRGDLSYQTAAAMRPAILLEVSATSLTGKQGGAILTWISNVFSAFKVDKDGFQSRKMVMFSGRMEKR